MRDFRYAVRSFAKTPGFTAVAVATLALGIGANSAIFSVVNAVLLKPLPFERPGELVRVTSDFERTGGRDLGLSAQELFDYRGEPGVFAEICGIWPINANLTGVDHPERTEVLLADANYFRLLGVTAQAGRVFGPSDYAPGIGPAAVISDGFWRRHFGGSPAAVGKTIRVDDDLYTIIGVAPRGFRHPGRHLETEIDLWAPSGWIASPFPTKPNRRAYLLQGGLARLAPGVTPAQAQARLDRLALQLKASYPEAYPESNGWRPRVISLRDDLVGGKARSALLVLLAAVGLVLLIACANVANLLLARASSRQREIAVRQALGASRRRLVRQLLTESLLLALCGAGLGLALATWSLDLFQRLAPAALSTISDVSLDGRVLLFTLAASIATGLAFGLVPALQALRPQLQRSLQEGARSGGSARSVSTRSALVVSELALALVLLVAAGLLLRTLWSLQSVDAGFDPKGVSTVSLWLPQPNIPENGRYFQHAARVGFYRKIFERMAEVPGVKAGAISSAIPFGSNRSISPFLVEGRDPERGGTGSAEVASVSPGYFATLRIPLVRGRAFTDRDDEQASAVAVVSEALARRYFPGEDPIGRRVRQPGRTGLGPWMSIVGIAQDVKTTSLDTEGRPLLYRPIFQSSNMGITFVLRGDAPPAQIAGGLERGIRSIDPELPLFAARTMDQAMAGTMAERRFAMALLLLFAGLALLLSTVGVYGVIAYSVEQRTHEIGIRLALGARPAEVLRLVLAQGARLASGGIALGLAGAVLVTRALSALLFGVSPRDPATFAAIAVLLAAVALFACWLPARRAARLEPMTALRIQ